MTKDNWQWWSGTNDEYMTNGPFACREDAIEALDGYGGYIVEAKRYPITFSAERLINEQYFECEDYFCGEYTEPARYGDADFVATADAELQQLLDGWLAKWSVSFIQPEMFCRQRNDEYIPADGEDTES